MSNSSVFNICAKVLKSLQDLQLNEREFQTAGALTLKALADNVNDVRSTVSNSLSADFRQRPELVMDQVRQVGWSRRCSGLVGDDSQFVDNALAHWKPVKLLT